MAAKHLHKGQGIMPNGGKGWHHAFQTGREGRLERERERKRRGVVVNSASLVQKEEVPSCWQESRLNLWFDCVLDCPFICLIAKRSTLH